MKSPNYDLLQAELEKKEKARKKPAKPKMKVDGLSVKKIQKMIIKRGDK